MSTLIKHRDACRSFASTHLAECAAELREWQDTTILRDGRLRELAKMCCKFIDNHDGLRVAESFVNRAAIDAAAAPAPVVGQQDDCETCGGHGLIDGFVGGAAPGYESEPCPACEPATPPVVQQGELPPLPQAGNATKGGEMVYYASQMHEYGRAAIAASAGQGEADASLWPCGDCGKAVKTSCSNRPCGYRAMQQQANEAAKASPQPQQGAITGWVADPDAISPSIITACRDAICYEFGVNGTDGYYKRILVKVFRVLAATQSLAVDAEITAKDAKQDDFIQSDPLSYAQFLAWKLWRDHYKAASPDFVIMGHMAGVLSQIDNMTCGWKAADAESLPDLARAMRRQTGNWKEQSYAYRDRLLVALEELAAMKSAPAAQGDKQ